MLLKIELQFRRTSRERAISELWRYIRSKLREEAVGRKKTLPCDPASYIRTFEAFSENERDFSKFFVKKGLSIFLKVCAFWTSSVTPLDVPVLFASLLERKKQSLFFLHYQEETSENQTWSVQNSSTKSSTKILRCQIVPFGPGSWAIRVVPFLALYTKLD